MRKWKRRLAGLLCAGLLVSTLPAQALAAEDNGEEDVIYNTGHMNVTVTADESRLDEDFTAPFAADGSYVIELDEPEPFFPYEVQFTCGGETWSEWFAAPEDTVSVGGHAFSLDVLGEAKSLDFQVGGTTVRARPAAKTFVHDPYAAAEASLLPLKESFYDLDLRGYLPNDLKAVGVDDILKALTPRYGGDAATGDASKVAVWAKWSYQDEDGNYVQDDERVQRLVTGEPLDLSSGYSYSTWLDLELIVGTADQFDSSNERYIIRVQTTGENDIFQFTARTADGTKEIPIIRANFYTSHNSSGEEKNIYSLSVDKAGWSGGEALLSMKLKNEKKDLTATVYKGCYDTEVSIPSTAEDITDQIWDKTNDGYKADYSHQSGYAGMQAFTVVLKQGEKTVLFLPMVIRMYEAGYELLWTSYLYRDENGTRTRVSPKSTHSKWNQTYYYSERTFVLEENDPANETYYWSMTIKRPDDTWGDSNDVKAAYAKYYATLAEIDADTARVDIKDQLFSEARETDGGYGADFSEGVVFTVVDPYDELHHYSVKTAPYVPDVPDAPRPNSEDTYFRVTGAKGLRDYVMPYQHDGYYYNGYQTVFLLNDDGTAVADGTQIAPYFTAGDKVKVFAGHNGSSATEQVSGVSAISFESGKALQYSAAAQSNAHLKNYWVTFLTQKTGGPALFVNAANDPDRFDKEEGIPVREVYLTEEFGKHHDIFFANIGDEEMTDISVKLENAQNVKLDEYWTVNNDAAAESRKLAAFTTVVPKDAEGNNVSYGELPNVAKLRLVPDGSGGIISGKLIISAANVDPVTIKLTGISGELKITTETIADGVKYVPYSSVIQTNSMGASDDIRFELTDGSLPTGVTLAENGKLYGMPTQAGEYTFTVQAVYRPEPSVNVSREYTITIKDNTAENVAASTDKGYELIEPTYEMDGSRDMDFHSNGALGEFYAFYLDGQKLTPGTDYTAEEGSTRVTIRSQTLRNAGSGSHTLAAEFRTDRNDTATVKCAAQNYTLSTGGSGSGSGGGKPSKNPQPATPPAAGSAGSTFGDIKQTDWFYSDVDWAYQQGLMIGVTGNTFAPNGSISTATVITVLSRLGRVDLTGYDPAGDPAIPAGVWYGKAAAWAKQMGLLPDDFAAQPTISRAKLAVMLVKYLKLQGVDCTPPERPVAFTDAGKMTAEENAAFQILYRFGIFKGTGDGSMNPLGSTSRAHLAALLHRLSVFVENGRA